MGNRHSTKFVLAVPKTSTNVRSTQFTRGGSAQVEQKKRRLLQTYATSVAALIRASGGELELWRIGDRLKRMGNGFSIAAREAGLNQKGVIASFLRAFPERFELNIPRQGGKSTVILGYMMPTRRVAIIHLETRETQHAVVREDLTPPCDQLCALTGCQRMSVKTYAQPF